MSETLEETERKLQENRLAESEEVSDLHVVLGASGPLGRAVISRLQANSQRVRAVVLESAEGGQWFPAGVEVAMADPKESQSITENCREAKVVYDCFEPNLYKWKQIWPEVTAGILEGVIDAGSTVMFSSPLISKADENSKTEYQLLKANEDGLIRAAVVRVPQLYGHGVSNPMWKIIFDCAIEGKKAHWIGDLEVRRTFLDVDDAAEAMVAIGGSQFAFGKAWNVASPGTLTGREFIELAFKVAGNTPKVGKWGRGFVLTGSMLAPDARAVIEMPYDYYKSFVLDGKDFAEAFPAFSYTAPEKTMAKALNWYKQQLTTAS